MRFGRMKANAMRRAWESSGLMAIMTMSIGSLESVDWRVRSTRRGVFRMKWRKNLREVGDVNNALHSV